MHWRALLLVASISLVPGVAGAVATEPNGTQIPLDSGNGEVQLYTFFSDYAHDPVDWQQDAATTPSQFSPLCGFTATFMLHCAGSDLDFGWYNVADPATIHKLISGSQIAGYPGNPPGCHEPIDPPITFTGTSIRNDPAYTGGLIGFALYNEANAGYKPHYSDYTLDQPPCSGCAMPGPWITAVIYPSKTTPNAYYIAFEDGTTTATSFANDGDFNDDVFFLTGLTCEGGGQPCDTGKPGICAAGLTQCTGNGIVCQQLNQPKPKETCNGLDDDCNGMVDEGDGICPSMEICDKGTCVKRCGGAEFKCATDKVCDDGLCVDPACKGVSCDAGKVCVHGTCHAPCDGVTCPYPEVCRVGACVDPCAGVTCDTGQVCDGGVCVASCTCAPCSSSTACDADSGHCVDPSCVGKTCAMGKHCDAGSCVSDCQGAMCPDGQTCAMGQCVPGSGSGGSGGSTGAFGNVGGGDSGGAGGAGAGHGSASGAAGGGFGGTNGDAGASSGCGCRVGDEPRSGAALFLAGAGALLLGARSRRRRRG